MVSPPFGGQKSVDFRKKSAFMPSGYPGGENLWAGDLRLTEEEKT